MTLKDVTWWNKWSRVHNSFYDRLLRPEYLSMSTIIIEQNTTHLLPVFSVSLVSLILLKAVINGKSFLWEVLYSSTTILLTRDILKATFKCGIEMLGNLAIQDLFCIFLPLLQLVLWFLAIECINIISNFKFLVGDRAGQDFCTQKQSTEQ